MTTYIKRMALALASLGLFLGFVAAVPSLSASAAGGKTNCSEQAVATYTEKRDAWAAKVEKRQAKVDALAAKVKAEKKELKAAKAKGKGVAKAKAELRAAKEKLGDARSKGQGSLRAAQKNLEKYEAKLAACESSETPTETPTETPAE